MQVQQRSAQTSLSDSLWRVTALSIDSILYVPPTQNTHEYYDKSTHLAHVFTPSDFVPSNSKSAPSFKIYGLHLSLSEKKQTQVQTEVSDSNALGVQSSYDKSMRRTKATPSTCAPTLIAICFFIAGAIIIVRKLRNS